MNIKRSLQLVYSGLPLKRPIFHALKTVWSPPESVYRHLHFKGVISLKVDRDRAFKIYHHGYEVENTLFWKGLFSGWESLAMKVWSHFASRSRIIVDVGANTGIYSLVARTVNPEARVIAVEPIERVFAKLLKNVELNDFDIECHRAAASDSDGTAVILDFPGEHSYSSTFHGEIFDQEGLIKTEVATIRLKSLVEELGVGQIDLLKIDVEGHEPAVLEGMGKDLIASLPTILIEILTDEVGERVNDILKGSNYEYYYIDESSSELRKVESLTRRESYNYLICRPGKLNEIGVPISH